MPFCRRCHSHRLGYPAAVVFVGAVAILATPFDNGFLIYVWTKSLYKPGWWHRSGDGV